MKAHEPGDTAGHVRVTAEVEEDLPAKGDSGQDQPRRAVRLRVVIDAFDIERKVIGQRQFLEQTDEEQRRAVGEVLQADGRELAELREQMPGALDRPGHELGKETNERGETEKVPLALDVAQVEINRVTQRLEGEEGYPDREQVLEPERHERGRIGQFYLDMESGEYCVEILHNETGVFEKEQKGEVVYQ